MRRLGSTTTPQRHGITKKHDVIPPYLTSELYAKTIQLAAAGLGPAHIANQLSAAYSLKIAPGTVRHWAIGDRKPGVRNVFKEEPSPALSYVIGANIGDGCTLIESWCVKLEVTDMDFAQMFNANMVTLFSRVEPNKILVRRFDVDRLPMYIVKYSSRQLVELLRLPSKKLLELAFAFPREFLRGFFDAEGHVDIGARKTFEIKVGVENSDKALLKEIRLLLLKGFNIKSNINRKRRSGSLKVIRGKSFRMRKTSYSLLFAQFRSLRSFDRRIGFSILRKDQKLKDALTIFQRYGRKAGLSEWNNLYHKRNGEWVRRGPLI